MKTFLTCLLAICGLTTACGQAKEQRSGEAQVTYEEDVFQTKSGKTVKFHALVHASIRVEYDGKEIEIDPVTKLGNKTIDYTAMPKANFIFVTHEHGDHFDKEAIKQLSNDGTRLITNRRCADMLGSGQVMANGDKIKIADDFTVEAVPAYNITEGHTQFHPQGRDNGYILTIDGLRIYIAGDTEDIPEMASIKDIDIITTDRPMSPHSPLSYSLKASMSESDTTNNPTILVKNDKNGGEVDDFTAILHNLFQLLDREGEVSIGEGLILQCEVPPLAV